MNNEIFLLDHREASSTGYRKTSSIGAYEDAGEAFERVRKIMDSYSEHPLKWTFDFSVGRSDTVRMVGKGLIPFHGSENSLEEGTSTITLQSIWFKRKKENADG